MVEEQKKLMSDVLFSSTNMAAMTSREHLLLPLSSHITQHDEFIKATFSSEIFFETNSIFAIRGKNPFLFHYVREDKKPNRGKLP